MFRGRTKQEPAKRKEAQAQVLPNPSSAKPEQKATEIRFKISVVSPTFQDIHIVL
jgi:hypothetical protein